MRLLERAEKKKRRKFPMILLFILLFLTLVTVVPMITQPYRRPRRMARNRILQITPLGTSIEDVIKILEERDEFKHIHVDFENGFSLSGHSPPPREGRVSNVPRVGEMHVRVPLGGYRVWYVMLFLADVRVSAAWGFDSDGKLIEIHVDKGWGP